MTPRNSTLKKKYPRADNTPRISQVARAWEIEGRPGQDDTDAKLGQSVAVADFNGDGFADIAAGMPGDNGGRGSVAIIYGGASGMDLNNPDLSTRTRITEPAVVGFGNDRAGDQFGYALATGDFNADGLADLAISAPFRSVDGNAGAGEVYVLLGNRAKGAAGLLINRFTITQTGANASNEPHDHFGFSLAAGDFDGDSHSDLAIGAPDEDVEAYGANNAGAVFIRYGGPNGMENRGYHFITSAKRSPTTGTNTPQTNERFGYSLAAGQLHVNPYGHRDDLVVGAPGKTLRFHSVTAGGTLAYNSGMVYVFDGVQDQRTFNHALDVMPNLAPLGVRSFGHALAIGDFNGDTRNDLAIGAPSSGYTDASSGGFVFIADADANGRVGSLAYPNDNRQRYLRLANHHFASTGERYLTQLPIGLVENDDMHGAALVSADFNRDGYADLAVGAFREDWDGATNTGVVYIYLGGQNGLRRDIPNQFFLDQTPEGANEAHDWFGYALAAGNVDGDRDGFPDLVIGDPRENNGSQNAGAVFLARTIGAAPGQFQGQWSGTVNGDYGTSGTLTLNLTDRDGVGGTARLDNITKNACNLRDVVLGGRATVVAARTTETHAAGTLADLTVPSIVNSISLSMDVNGNQLSGRITVTSTWCDVTQAINNLTRTP